MQKRQSLRRRKKSPKRKRSNLTGGLKAPLRLFITHNKLTAEHTENKLTTEDTEHTEKNYRAD